jgi:hypothetical protein
MGTAAGLAAWPTFGGPPSTAPPAGCAVSNTVGVTARCPSSRRHLANGVSRGRGAAMSPPAAGPASEVAGEGEDAVKEPRLSRLNSFRPPPLSPPPPALHATNWTDEVCAPYTRHLCGLPGPLSEFLCLLLLSFCVLGLLSLTPHTPTQVWSSPASLCSRVFCNRSLNVRVPRAWRPGQKTTVLFAGLTEPTLAVTLVRPPDAEYHCGRLRHGLHTCAVQAGDV